MSVFAPALTFIWKAFESYGFDPELLFADEEFKVRLPMDPQQRIPSEIVDRMLARAVNISGEEAFGLRIGDYLQPIHLGALGYAWLASDTLRSALHRLSPYIRLINDRARVIVEKNVDYLVVSNHYYGRSENYAARDDMSMAILVQLCRFNCGPNFHPEQVEIRHAEPDDKTPWAKFFGCPVNFNATKNQIWISNEVADQKLLNANAQLALINEQLIAQELVIQGSRDIITRVCAEITVQLATNNINENSIAAAMKMTVRTLHRKLADKGTNFSSLLARIRRETADYYLKDPGLSLTEIAFQLGFSQVSSFSRAYRKWTGISPSAARENLLN